MEDALRRLTATVEDHGRRLATVESNQVVTDAVRVERDKHMDKRFDQLEESVSEVKGYLLRIVWVIILGIVGALMTFIISGGLNAIPTP